MRYAARALSLSVLLAAPAAAQSGTDAFNAELPETWDRMRPAIVVRLTQEAQAQLAAVNHTSGSTHITVDRVRSVRMTLDAAPGFAHVGNDRLAIAVPRRGTWRIEAEADVRVRTRILF